MDRHRHPSPHGSAHCHDIDPTASYRRPDADRESFPTDVCLPRMQDARGRLRSRPHTRMVLGRRHDRTEPCAPLSARPPDQDRDRLELHDRSIRRADLEVPTRTDLSTATPAAVMATGRRDHRDPRVIRTRHDGTVSETERSIVDPCHLSTSFPRLTCKKCAMPLIKRRARS